MLHRVTSVALILELVLALAGCKPTIIEDPEPEPTQPSDPAEDPLVEQEAVRVAVREYSAALREREAEVAAACVVAETFELYEDLRLASLRFGREDLERWDLLRIVMVLQIRATTPRAELEAVDGRRLFELAVERGLVGEGVGDLNLDEVWIADDRSVAQIRLDRAPIVWLRRTKADDGELRWRVDIPEIVRLTGPALEASLSEQVVADGKVRTAYTLLLLSNDRLIEFEIVDGPLPRDVEPERDP